MNEAMTPASLTCSSVAFQHHIAPTSHDWWYIFCLMHWKEEGQILASGWTSSIVAAMWTDLDWLQALRLQGWPWCYRLHTHHSLCLHFLEEAHSLFFQECLKFSPVNCQEIGHQLVPLRLLGKTSYVRKLPCNCKTWSLYILLFSRRTDRILISRSVVWILLQFHRTILWLWCLFVLSFLMQLAINGDPDFRSWLAFAKLCSCPFLLTCGTGSSCPLKYSTSCTEARRWENSDDAFHSVHTYSAEPDLPYLIAKYPLGTIPFCRWLSLKAFLTFSLQNEDKSGPKFQNSSSR